MKLSQVDVVRYGVVKSGVSLFSLSGSGGFWWLGRVLDISLSGAECLCFVSYGCGEVLAFLHRNISSASEQSVWSG